MYNDWILFGKLWIVTFKTVVHAEINFIPYICILVKGKKKLALFQDRMTLMIGMSGGLQNKDKLSLLRPSSLYPY